MSDRRIKVTQLIQQLTATFIRNEANSEPLITVTSVAVTPDLKRAIVFVTTIPDGREQDAVIFLKRNASALRQFIKQKAKIGTIPHLDFMVDAGEKHRQHMDELVQQIKNEQNEKSAD